MKRAAPTFTLVPPAWFARLASIANPRARGWEAMSLLEHALRVVRHQEVEALLKAGKGHALLAAKVAEYTGRQGWAAEYSFAGCEPGYTALRATLDGVTLDFMVHPDGELAEVQFAIFPHKIETVSIFRGRR